MMTQSHHSKSVKRIKLDSLKGLCNAKLIILLIPSGDHRPVWPKFGEYIFVPPQRWLHNIEVRFPFTFV